MRHRNNGTVEKGTLTPADRVKRLREHLQLSQRDLAEEFQVTPGAVAMWESGDRPLQGPSLRLLEIFEEELGIEVVEDRHGLKELSSIISSRFGRSLSLSGLASKALSIWIIELVKSSMASSQSRSQIQRKATVRMAMQAVEKFSEMKGLPMKLGQILSYHDLPMPEESRQLFASLQTSSVPLSAKVITQILKDEFGQTPKTLFAKWSGKPFAAASIGQVHLARLSNGQNVALKIQYPEIAKAIRSDLKNLSAIITLLKPFLGPTDAKAIVQELTERIVDECDYEKEMETQKFFGQFFAGRKEMLIPYIVPQFCRKNVLCSELLQGLGFQDFLHDSNQSERNLAARIIWKFSFEAMFWGRRLNADPHPGNYLFRDGAVVFLDFGCAKVLSDKFITGWRSVILNLIRHKRDEAIASLSDLGMFPHENIDREQLDLILDTIYEPFLKDQSFTYTPSLVKRSFAVWFGSERSRKSFLFPSEWVFMTRILFGLTSVLVSLKAEANWHRMMLDILERDELFVDSVDTHFSEQTTILPKSRP